MQQDRNWSQYWQGEGANGEVFVNKDGHKHPQLTEFWVGHFESLSAGAEVVDFASGAGSIYSNLPDPEKYQLIATDISEVALEQLNKRLPSVQTYCCSFSALPLKNASASLVVSQFGIEYAGIQAFKQATRLLAPGANLVTLSHIEDGYIDSKNKQELQGAELLNSTDFISLAMELTKHVSNARHDLAKPVFERFTQVEPLLSEYTNKVQQGLHAQVYQGFRKVFSNLSAYKVEEIIVWLTQMQEEAKKSVLRLTEMRKAALSPSDVEDLHQLLSNEAMVEIEIKPFTLSGHQLPVAWQIKAQKLS